MRALTLSRLPRAQEGRRWHREVVAYGEQLLCLCRSVARTLRDKPRTPVAICGMQAGGASRGPNLPHGRREALHNAAHGMCAGRTPTGQRRMAVPRTEGDVTMKVRQRSGSRFARSARWVLLRCTAPPSLAQRERRHGSSSLTTFAARPQSARVRVRSVEPMTYRHSSVCGECREVSSAIGPRRPASRTEPQTCGVRIWRKVKNLLYPHSQPLVQQARRCLAQEGHE